MISSSSLLIGMKLSTIGYRGTMLMRAFSSDCEPAIRLRNAIADYRQRNYTMELPSRFKKELLSPYSKDGGSSVDIDQLNNLLINIGYREYCLSTQEQMELLRNAGSNGREIPMKQMLELIE
ncbi:hypothetical protein IV203_007986 [Nitzschia inconspicua]|uniref:Uncharacterized protein n=1 Tax=Nitzschia inconspicua TaxID=303405 RepID=A0A9K3KXZ8_9STRA|nr:hypothetical protein IV203_007986 [Nitzschia inconspicua]